MTKIRESHINNLKKAARASIIDKLISTTQLNFDILVDNITFPAPSVRGESAHVNTIFTKLSTEDSENIIERAADLIDSGITTGLDINRKQILGCDPLHPRDLLHQEITFGNFDHISSGTAIFLNNALISWSAKKQNIVSTSSCEAEYKAASSIVKDSLYIFNLLKEMITVQLPIELYIHNTGAAHLTEKNLNNHRNKNIDLRYHHIRD